MNVLKPIDGGSQRTAASVKDYHSVLLHRCHNVGAGGVWETGKVIVLTMRRKRLRQLANRVARALGGSDE